MASSAILGLRAISVYLGYLTGYWCWSAGWYGLVDLVLWYLQVGGADIGLARI